MQDQDARDRVIAWALLPFVSPARTRLLLEYFDPLQNACFASIATLSALLNIDAAQAEQVKNPLRSAEMRDAVSRVRHSVIALTDDDYPPLLREIIDPPLALHVLGDRSLLQQEAIAVVGSRRASPYAVNAARKLVEPLARDAGLVIVSGLARGIDAAAHESALDAPGKTIAVLGTGIDVVYPRSHTKLFKRIEEQGLIVSEFPPGTVPLASNFPMRNRVISGLTRGTVIVEATNRSGSLITARMAAEQGREVFAVPGSIFSPGSEGTHRLIQYGAKLVHDANDVLDELSGFTRIESRRGAEPPEELREVLEVLARDEAIHIDAAATKLQRAPTALAESLLQLELGGWVKALPGSRYVRVK